MKLHALLTSSLVLPLALAAGCASEPRNYEEGSPEAEIQEKELVLAAGADEEFEDRWRLASRCLDLVSRPTTPDDEKLDYARKAEEHANVAAALRPERVEGHFYLAVAMGQVLYHSSVISYLQGKISDMEEAALRAREIDPSFRCSAPLRFLAILYVKAPAWPTGPENAKEDDVIEELFGEALERSEDCPDNHLAYAEYLAESGLNREALEHAQRAEQLLPAHTRHTGGEPLQPYERAELTERLEDLRRALGAGK
jgi:tetratricopeptide (TPR) repeat protein